MPGKEHATPTTRTPSIVSRLSLTRCRALRPVEPRMRLRPRVFELPAPVHHDLFAFSPSKGGVDSFVIRSGSRDSIPRGFDTALQESRRASTEMRATDFCHAHVRYEHPRSSSGYRRIEAFAPRVALSCEKAFRCMARFTTPHTLRRLEHRARRRRVNPAKNAASDSPLTLPSPRRIRPSSSFATESASGSAEIPCITCLVKGIAMRRDQGAPFVDRPHPIATCFRSS